MDGQKPTYPELFFFGVSVASAAVIVFVVSAEILDYQDRRAVTANVGEVFSLLPEEALRSAEEGEKASVVNPVPGSAIEFPVRFFWTPGTNTEEYWLSIGTSIEALNGAPWGNVYAASAGQRTEELVYPQIPVVSGMPLYVRLWSWVHGNWEHADYLYEAR